MFSWKLDCTTTTRVRMKAFSKLKVIVCGSSAWSWLSQLAPGLREPSTRRSAPYCSENWEVAETAVPHCGWALLTPATTVLPTDCRTPAERMKKERKRKIARRDFACGSGKEDGIDVTSF